MPEQITESVQVSEAESLGNGRYRVVAITAGRGSSGTYPPDTLREAANRNLLARGTHSFWDHDTTSGRHERPERSVRDLVGVFTSDARWDENLQGLVAEYQVFKPYRELFSELAEHVGLSIVGDGDIVMENGERVVKSLEHIHSVDLVTRAGRGGKVLSVLESARPAFDSADMAAVSGVPHNAMPPQIVPVDPAADTPTQESQEDTMPQIEEARMRELEEAAGRVPTLEAERDAARQEATEAKATLAEATARQGARPVVAAKVAESKTLGARTQARLVESIVAGLPIADGKVDDEQLTAAVKSQVDAAEAEIADYARATPAPLFGSFGSVNESHRNHTHLGDGHLTESAIDSAVGAAFGRTVKGN